MLKLLSAQQVILILAFVVLATSAAISWTIDLFGAGNQTLLGHWRMVGFVVFGIFIAVTHPIVWRWFWSVPGVGRLLSTQIVPDLTGFWKFTVQSNYPIIAALKEERGLVQSDTGLSEYVFIGFFRQGWLTSDFEVFGHDGSILDSSDTLLVEFRPGPNKRKKKIFWFYEQTNKLVDKGDTGTFQGASELEIQRPTLITGLTWSNRNWENGGNTAGPIRLERLEKAPLKGMSDDALSERAVELYREIEAAVA